MPLKMISGSIYLPHIYLQKFVKECFSSLCTQIKERHRARLINYHLSTYKGENISFHFGTPKDTDPESIKNILVRLLEAFLKKVTLNHSPQSPPLNRLFLNIPEGSIHFWDKIPFHTRHLFKSEATAEDDIRCLVSQQCLNVIGEAEIIDDEILFRTYLVLLISTREMLTGNYRANFVDILTGIINRFKKRKEISSEISQIEKRTLRLYKEKKPGLNREIGHILNSISPSNPGHIIPVKNSWKGFLSDVDGLCPSMTPEDRSELYLNLITDITQKLSLNIGSLVKAAVILRESRK